MLVAADNETHLFQPGNMAPRLVCVSIAYDHVRADVIHRRDPACYRTVRALLEDPDVTLGGHNLPYDVAVWVSTWPELLPLSFELLESERSLDSQVRQKLIDIAKGCYRGYQNLSTGKWVEHKYNLAALAHRHGYPVELDKDTWRLRFGEFDDTPIEEIPTEAVDYSRHDSLATRHVIVAQEADADFLQDQHRQGRAHWALHLISTWGIRTDPKQVARYRLATEDRLGQHQDLLVRKNFLVYNEKKGSWHKKDKLIQEYAESALGDKAKRTATGRVELSADAVPGYKDPILTAYQEYKSAAIIMGHVEELEQGVEMPIHTRFDELMETGRTSSSKPNIQNRWAGNDPDEAGFGDRECFVPRDGNVFLVSDVPGLELRTIAQVLLFSIGRSKLAEALRSGEDPHLMVAAQLLAIDYAEAKMRYKNPDDVEIYLARQTGKVANFGLNAGLGWKGLIEQARTKYDVILDERQAKILIRVFHDTWEGDFLEFFKWVKSMCGGANVATVHHYGSMRYRGYIPYTVVCNTFSQGMGADATKAALWALVKECYVGALRGSRVVNYIHDEYLTETAEEDLDRKAGIMGKTIVDAVNEWIPDVPIPEEKMRPIACRRWSKLAKRVVDEQGRLKAWEWDRAA